MNRRTPKPTTHTHGFSIVGADGWPSAEVSITFRLDREMVPLGENPRTFRGYPTFFHALTVASTTANIGLIYQASFNHDVNRQDNPFWFGYFLVFDTGMKPFTRRIFPYTMPAGVINVRFTNLEKKTDARTWTKRTEEIKGTAGGTTVRDIYPLLKRIVEDFAYLDSLEVYANPAVENKLLTDRERRQLFRSNAVNIHYQTEEEDKGYFWVINQDTEQGTAIFCEPSNAESPISYFALTSAAFETSHPIHLLSTMAHESMHMLNSYRAAFLLEQWRRSRDPRKGEFHMWVRDRSKRSNSRVTQYDFLLAMALCGRMNARSLVHFEPHVEGWILTATYLPVSELRFRSDTKPSDIIAFFPAISDFITIEEKYYNPSPYLDIVLNRLESRLVKTYKNLSQERRGIIQESFVTWKSTVAPKDPHPFFEWLFKIWSIKSR